MRETRKVTLTTSDFMFYGSNTLEQYPTHATIDLGTLDINLFRDLPVIVNHKADFTSDDIIGFVRDPKFEGNRVIGTLEFEPFVKAEQFEGREVSLSYHPSDYNPNTKMHSIEKVMHLAVVEDGRCGGVCIIEIFGDTQPYMKDEDKKVDSETDEVVDSESDKDKEKETVDSEEDDMEDEEEGKKKKKEKIDSSSQDINIEILKTLKALDQRISSLEQPKKTINSAADSFSLDWCATNDKIYAITGQREDLNDYDGNTSAALRAATNRIAKVVQFGSTLKENVINSAAPAIRDYKTYIDLAFNIHKEKIKEEKQSEQKIINSAKDVESQNEINRQIRLKATKMMPAFRSQ